MTILFLFCEEGASQNRGGSTTNLTKWGIFQPLITFPRGVVREVTWFSGGCFQVGDNIDSYTGQNICVCQNHKSTSAATAATWTCLNHKILSNWVRSSAYPVMAQAYVALTFDALGSSTSTLIKIHVGHTKDFMSTSWQERDRIDRWLYNLQTKPDLACSRQRTAILHNVCLQLVLPRLERRSPSWENVEIDASLTISFVPRRGHTHVLVVVPHCL